MNKESGMNTKREIPEPRTGAYDSETLVDLVEVGKTLTSTFDPDTILDLIMEKVSGLIKAENWSLLLKDENSGETGL